MFVGYVTDKSMWEPSHCSCLSARHHVRIAAVRVRTFAPCSLSVLLGGRDSPRHAQHSSKLQACAQQYRARQNVKKTIFRRHGEDIIRKQTVVVYAILPGQEASSNQILRGTIVNTLVGPMVYIKTTRYLFNHFYSQHLVLLTMVPRNITGDHS